MIRGLFTKMSMAVMLCALVLLAGCTKEYYITSTTDSPDTPAGKAPTYTIMLYGTGGGNLDAYFNYNMEQLAAAGKKDRVNFRALFKYSRELQSQDKYEGTRLLTLTKDEGLKSEKKYEASYRMDNPAHLTEFIKETKEQMPADKYILIFWDHGSLFGSSDKLVQDSYPETSGAEQSRAVLFDDNVNGSPMMSIYEIEKGIKESGEKLDLVYLDACLMGMIENYAQLKDLTSYMMAAFMPTPGLGGNYSQLQASLQNTQSLEEAMRDFVPKCVNDWKIRTGMRCDLECYDMSYMNEFLGYAKNALDIYVEGTNSERRRYMEENSIDDNGLLLLSENGGASGDLLYALSLFDAARLDGKLSSAIVDLNLCLAKMTVAQSCVRFPEDVDRVSMGIRWPTLITKDLFREKNFDKIYCPTVFDQYTKWSNHLIKYKDSAILRILSPFFNKDNELNIGDNFPIYYYYCKVNLDGEKKLTYSFTVRWYLEEEDMQSGNSIEKGQSYIEQLNEIYEQGLKGKKCPLSFSSSLDSDVQKAIETEPSISSVANKVHVEISVRDKDTYDKDPDKEKYPMTHTLRLDLRKKIK